MGIVLEGVSFFQGKRGKKRVLLQKCHDSGKLCFCSRTGEEFPS